MIMSSLNICKWFFPKHLELVIALNPNNQLELNERTCTYCNVKDVHIEILQPQLSKTLVEVRRYSVAR